MLPYPGTLSEGIFANTPLNTCEIPQDILNIQTKVRTNPLPWQGQFSPQLVEALLSYYRSSTSWIMDPFVGSGTVLFEGIRQEKSVVGVEVNPAAFNLSSFYTLAILSNSQRRELKETITYLNSFLANGIRFQPNDPIEDSSKILCQLWREVIQEGTFVRGFPEFLAALMTLTDFSSPTFSIKRFSTISQKLLCLLDSLPHLKKEKVIVKLGDARATRVESNSIDLVLTSPPYINVYNYHQKYRGAVEAMGWNVLSSAKSEIGANRKHRGNRLRTVIQYCLDMAEVLAELARVVKGTGHIVLVVGRQSMVCKIPFFNSEIITEIACAVLGYQMSFRQERVFLNRFGNKIHEDILHLLPPLAPLPDVATREESVRLLARKILENVFNEQPKEASKLLLGAIEAIEEVKPSVVFNGEEKV